MMQQQYLADLQAFCQTIDAQNTLVFVHLNALTSVLNIQPLNTLNGQSFPEVRLF
jgi:hypothetical protein